MGVTRAEVPVTVNERPAAATTYPVTATLSVAGAQLRVAEVAVAVAVSAPGVLGGVVSGGITRVRKLTLAALDLLPAASTARTVAVYAVFGVRLPIHALGVVGRLI